LRICDALQASAIGATSATPTQPVPESSEIKGLFELLASILELFKVVLLVLLEDLMWLTDARSLRTTSVSMND